MGPGGLQQNIFSADPTEGVKRLFEFGGDPTRERMRAFIQHDGGQPGRWSPTSSSRSGSPAATAPGSREAMASMGASFMNPETFEQGMLWREAYKIRHHTLLTWGREDRVNPIDGAFLGAQADPASTAARVPELRPLGTDRGGGGLPRGDSRAFLAQHRERTGRS